MKLIGTAALPVRSFSKEQGEAACEIPNLLAIQLSSYERFLQREVPPEERQNEGLQEVFKSVFPIEDSRGMFCLEFVSYGIGEPKYSVEECQERDLTFSVPLKVKLRLRIREEVDGKKRDKEIMEPQEVYLGEIPLITEKGTFVINGAERVIVSQLHRSPGVFFESSVHPNGKRLFNARIIPYRGSWVEFSIDVKDIMYVHIDRKRKLPASVLLKALGIVTDKDILDLFYAVRSQPIGGLKTKRTQALIHRISAEDIIDPETGEILLECNQEISEEVLKRLIKVSVESVSVYDIPLQDEADIIRNTLKKDTTTSEEEALGRIYGLMRPGEPPRLDTAREYLNRLFFSPKRYDLAQVGRYKVNGKLKHEALLGGKRTMKRYGFQSPPDDLTTLCREDFAAILRYLLLLRISDSEEIETPVLIETDDIDHLGNRADGADHPRAHVAPGSRAGQCLRLHQRTHHLRRGAELLWIQPAVAVHGSDQPAGRADAQAPALGSRTGRTDAGPRRLRGPRRSLHALWPHVPHRDARRAQHRSDLVPVLLRPRESPRLPGDPLPQGEQQHGEQPCGVPLRGPGR
jgi:DNA-directed RNA polymerase subunit beta